MFIHNTHQNVVIHYQHKTNKQTDRQTDKEQNKKRETNSFYIEQQVHTSLAVPDTALGHLNFVKCSRIPTV